MKETLFGLTRIELHKQYLISKSRYHVQLYTLESSLIRRNVNLTRTKMRRKLLRMLDISDIVKNEYLWSC